MKVVIQPKYDDARPFREDLVAVRLNGKYGFIDQTGREVAPSEYDGAGPFSEGLARVGIEKWEGGNFIGKYDFIPN